MRSFIPSVVAIALSACARSGGPAAEAPTCPTCPEVEPTQPEEADEPDEPEERELVLRPASFADIDGWEDDDAYRALPPLLRSCERLAGLAPDTPIGPDGLAGTAATWQPICAAADDVADGNSDAARSFFSTHFSPYLATDRGDAEGRFTGYYEAEMHGARRRRGKYRYPIYKRPPELVMVEMKNFYDSPRPRRIAGKVEEGRLVPYYTRAEIAAGALAGRGLELFWVTNPVDAFFAQIQGSGIVELPDGSQVRVGYAGKNGHRYTAIGRELAREGAFPAAKMSMQAIRTWLESHPKRARDMMNRNDGFVFFQEESRPGAIGAQGIVLTAERSVAVDPYFIPLSSPIFVITEVPDPKRSDQTMPFRQLVIAQDTGGAIRGPVRGDIFWGHGERATSIAGRLKSQGRYYLFLPRAVAPEIAADGADAGH